MKKKSLLTLTVAVFFICLYSSAAHSVPTLQLGDDPTQTDATYDNTTQTWDVGGTDSSFSFNAYNLGTDSWTAYLVFAAVPKLTDDVFDITVSDGDLNLTLVSEGFGNPPFEDPNSLAPHDIYSTWSEIYLLEFNGSNVTVPNTQPGDDGTATGRVETITVNINSLDLALAGIHIDMFTADWSAVKDKDIVTGFAPFSHDAQWNSPVPIPPSVLLFGSGLIAFSVFARRKKSSTEELPVTA